MQERAARAQDPRRDAAHHRAGRHVVGHHCAGADDGALADRDAGQDRGAGADVGAPADADRTDVQVCADHRRIGRLARVSRPQDAHAGPDAHRVAHLQITRVQERLRADPDPLADQAVPVVTSLQHGLVTDVKSTPESKGLEVPEADMTPDRSAVTEARAERTPQHASHRRVERITAGAKPVPQRQQCGGVAPAAQGGRQPELVRRIGRQRAPREERGHLASFGGRR